MSRIGRQTPIHCTTRESNPSFHRSLFLICCMPGAVLGVMSFSPGNQEPSLLRVGLTTALMALGGSCFATSSSGSPAPLAGTAPLAPMTRGGGSVPQEDCCACCRRTPGLSCLSSCWHHQLCGHHFLPSLGGARVQPGSRERPAEDRAEFCRARVIPVSDRSQSPEGGGVLGGEEPPGVAAG